MPQNCNGLTLPTAGLQGIPTSLVFRYDGSPLSNIPNIIVGTSTLNDVIFNVNQAIGSSSSPTSSTVTWDGANTIDCITFNNPSTLNDVVSSLVTEICDNAQDIATINEVIAALDTGDIDVASNIIAASCPSISITQGETLSQAFQKILDYICANQLAISSQSQDEHNIQWQYFGSAANPIVEVNNWILHGYDYSLISGLQIEIDASVADLNYCMQDGYLYQTDAVTYSLGALRDVYIDINPTGSAGGTATLTKYEVPNGNVPPPVASGHIRIWKIVTNATTVVSTEDRRNYYNQDGTRLTDNSIITRHILDSNVTGAKLENFGTGAGSLAIGLMDMQIDAKGRVQSYVDNTNLSALNDNDILTYDAATSKWINSPLSSIGLPTGTLQGQTLGWNNTTSVWDVYSSFRLIGSSAIMGADIVPNTTFQIGGGGSIGIENAAPSAATLNPFAAGSLSAGVYYVSIASVDVDGNESRLSDEAQITIDAVANNSFTISWSAAPYSSGDYKVFVSNTSGTYTEYKLVSGLSLNFDGSVTMTAGFPSNASSFAIHIGDQGGYGYNAIPTTSVANHYKSNGVTEFLHKLEMVGTYSGASIYGLYARINAVNNAGTSVGGWFDVTNGGEGANHYVLRLEDGVDNTGKYLKCIDNNGHMVFASGTGSGGSIGTEWNGTSVDSNTSVIDFKGDAVYQALTLGGGGVEFYFDINAANVGSTGEGIFKQKTSPSSGNPAEMQFKKLVAGTGMSFTVGTDTITLNSSGGGGGGEVNTMANVGTGAGEVYKQKVGVQFELKTIKAGSNITITNNTDDIEIIGNAGTVTSVGLSGGLTGLTVTGTPITSSGTFVLGGTLGVGYGGTGLSTISTGGIYYASAVDTLSVLSAGTNGHVLTLAGGIPTWAAPTGGGGLFVEDTVIAGANIYGGTGAGADLTAGATDSYLNFLGGINAGLVLTTQNSHNNVVLGHESFDKATTAAKNVIIGNKNYCDTVSGSYDNVSIGYYSSKDFGNNSVANIILGSKAGWLYDSASSNNIVIGKDLKNAWAAAGGTPTGFNSTPTQRSYTMLIGSGTSVGNFTRQFLLGDFSDVNTDIDQYGEFGLGQCNDFKLLINGGFDNPYGMKPRANLHVVGGGDGSGEIQRKAFIITQAYDQTAFDMDFNLSGLIGTDIRDIFYVDEFGNTFIQPRQATGGLGDGGLEIFMNSSSGNAYLKMKSNAGTHEYFTQLQSDGTLSLYNTGKLWRDYTGSEVNHKKEWYLGTASIGGLVPVKYMSAEITATTASAIDRIEVIIEAAGSGSKIDISSPTVEINGYIMPAADGSANQVLQTDGGGNVSWATITSGGGGGWTVVTKTGATSSATDGDYCLINSGTHSITLPAPAADARVGVKQILALSGVIEILTTGATVKIDGTSGYNTAGSGYQIYNQWDALTFVSDGTDWFIEA
jgi:hypothetical protein